MSYQTKNPIAEALESVRSGIGFPMGDFSQIMYSELGYGVPGSANSFVSNLFCYGQIYGNSGCKKEPLVQLERTAKILYALGVPEDHEVIDLIKTEAVNGNLRVGISGHEFKYPPEEGIDHEEFCRRLADLRAKKPRSLENKLRDLTPEHREAVERTVDSFLDSYRK